MWGDNQTEGGAGDGEKIHLKQNKGESSLLYIL